jgi:hypothetical protein
MAYGPTHDYVDLIQHTLKPVTPEGLDGVNLTPDA